MHDYYSDIDWVSFRVTADFAVDGLGPGTDLGVMFNDKGDGVWELKLVQPIERLPRGKLVVAVKDRQGNVTRIEREFSVKE